MSAYQWNHPFVYGSSGGIELLGMMYVTLLAGLALGGAAFLAQVQAFFPDFKPAGSMLEIGLAILALLLCGPAIFTKEWDQFMCVVAASLLTILHGVCTWLKKTKTPSPTV
jgi:hypothetical protein